MAALPSGALLQFRVAMGDLYADDITSETSCPARTLLQDIKNLIASGQREGPLLDYKADISPKDNWPETIAAFANTFGGIILFGVEGQADQPRRLTGYDPKGIEMKTRLSSTILSRIQPRPDIHLRVLTHDTDPTKEIAILRVSEGTHPPYMHNKGDEHRIYVRTGAQKAEADYLQLNALYDKCTHTIPPASVSTTDLYQRLAVKNPGDKNRPSEHWFRFIMNPETQGASRRLTAPVEQDFEDGIIRFFTGGFSGPGAVREQHLTLYRHQKDVGHEEVFAVTSDGTIGYATHACTFTNDGLLFSPMDFCADLISFLGLATRFSEHARYYGEFRLTVNIMVPEANIFKPGTFRGKLVVGSLFEPLPKTFAANGTAETRVTLHPATGPSMHHAVASIANDVARAAGTVLSPSFDQFADALIKLALQTLAHP